MKTTAYAADRSALLIVDNDFTSEGGKFYEATRETAEAVGVNDNALADSCDPGGEYPGSSPMLSRPP